MQLYELLEWFVYDFVTADRLQKPQIQKLRFPWHMYPREQDSRVMLAEISFALGCMLQAHFLHPFADEPMFHGDYHHKYYSLCMALHIPIQ